MKRIALSIIAAALVTAIYSSSSWAVTYRPPGGELTPPRVNFQMDADYNEQIADDSAEQGPMADVILEDGTSEKVPTCMKCVVHLNSPTTCKERPGLKPPFVCLAYDQE